MKEYTYITSGSFEEKLAEKAKNDLSVAKRVIEIECEVSIAFDWNTAVYYYPANKIADVLALSARKGIVSSNEKIYILHENYIECADDLISDYEDFEQAVYSMWESKYKQVFKPLYDTVEADNWQMSYIKGNEPTSFEIRLIDSLVANREYGLLDELVTDKCWSIAY